MNARKIKRVTGAQRQQLEILQLRSAVAFAKRMNIVYVTDDDGRTLRELLGRQSTQESSSNKTSMHVGHAGDDDLTKLELLGTAINLDRPDFPGPIVYVLEKMAMDRAKLRKVESTTRHAFTDPLNDE